ncbi:peroxiredoxin Q/BCP [Gillisia sp. Hel_I_86]|uniref:peroxiredoxin n=1 Tax=Gillisia sp. Hel_I_86 TaxID=1249981 RepID=UPI00119C0D80|nr:peroxiredoxin [Gillisia sp. Hel_I_86]TVZ25449.1 peroxiredoxin Q/BCP [Gillisia sp. Hel_I_86]
MALKIGDKIPNISIPDETGELFALNKFSGKQALVVYFYPKNFTPGCTKEACEFRDKYEEFKAMDAEVIGISSDSEASHKRFKSKYQLPFIFLSDIEKKARNAFGVKPALLGLLPGRETFVFDKKGELIMQYNNFNAASHTTKAIKKIKMQKDE